MWVEVKKHEKYSLKEFVNNPNLKDLFDYKNAGKKGPVIDWLFEVTVIGLLQEHYNSDEFLPDLGKNLYTKEALEKAFTVVVKWIASKQIKLNPTSWVDTSSKVFTVKEIDGKEKVSLSTDTIKFFKAMVADPKLREEVFEKYIYPYVSEISPLNVDPSHPDKASWIYLKYDPQASIEIIHKLFNILKEWERQEVAKKAKKWLEELRKQGEEYRKKLLDKSIDDSINIIMQQKNKNK